MRRNRIMFKRCLICLLVNLTWSQRVIGQNGDTGFKYSSPDLRAVIGEPVALSCLIEGQDIQWSKDGVPVVPHRDKYVVKSSQLKLPSIQRDQFGSYNCKTKDYSADITIRRRSEAHPCKIVWSHVPDHVSLTELTGFSTLQCNSYSYGVNISWSKDNIPIVTNSRIRILPNGYLRIGNPIKSDEGLYTCNAIFKDSDECKRYVSAFVEVKQLAQDCGGLFTALSGVIESPGYPTAYPDGADCNYNIILPSDERVFLSFQNLSLEFSNNCELDYVEICDSDCRRYCSGHVNIQSKTNQLKLRFHSDELISYSGFRAVYSTSGFESKPGFSGPCTWINGIYNGSISSPNNPELLDPAAVCTIELSAPTDSEIVFLFENLQLDCQLNHVLLQGDSSENPTRVCNQITTNTNRWKKLRIEFKANSSKGSFKAIYYFIKTSGNQPSTMDPDTSKFDQHPVDVNLELGEVKVLPCIPKDPYATIRWYKEDVLLLDTSAKDIVVKPINGVSIAIKSLRLKMTGALVGIYTCEAVSVTGSHVVKALINLKGSSSLKQCDLVTQSSKFTIFWSEYSDSRVLFCKGSEVKSVTWTVNGREIRVDGSKYSIGDEFDLTVNKIRSTDSGIYTCTAVGEDCKQTLNFKIKVQKEECGRPKVKPATSKAKIVETRIVGGNKALNGSYPWQVAIYRSGGTIYICGGGLLSKRWVLSAAHCFTEYKTGIVAKLGRYNRFKETEPGEQVVAATKIFAHQHYNKPSVHNNDICLIRLAEEVTYTDVVSPVCVTPKNFRYPRRTGAVAGWGRVCYKGAYPEILQEISIPIQGNDICQESSEIPVTENMFCAGYREEVFVPLEACYRKLDSCEGDSGSPYLIEQDGGNWFVAGIVSFGVRCGGEGNYGFYTKVEKYVDWIQNTIDNN